MISKIVKEGLCTGCGTCAGICPNDAITMTIEKDRGIYIPKIDEKKCNRCDLCVKVCSGDTIDYEDTNRRLYGKIPENIFVGNYETCYSGYSGDYDIRNNSSSGGVVTQLLIFALESKLIEGALVTRMNKNNPLEPEPFIARTKEEIIEASTSKYCPVPANIAIKEILKTNIKCAVVGLPCHINGIRKAEQINKKLKELVVLHIGLFCAYNINFTGTNQLFKWMNIEREKVKKYSYRGNGWPGHMEIETKQNEIKKIPLPIYYGRFFLDYSYSPKRCLLCSDLTCELSDISFGDAWLPEYSHDKVGTSIIVVRNEIGNSILKKAVEINKILLEEIPIKKVIESQKNPLYLKKKNVNARIQILRKNIKYSNTYESSIIDYFIAYYFCLNQYLHTKSYYRDLLLNNVGYNIDKYAKLLFHVVYSKAVKKQMRDMK